jgi:hypothetical protein
MILKAISYAIALFRISSLVFCTDARAIAGMFFHNINFLPLLRVIAFSFSKRKGAIAYRLVTNFELIVL